MTTQSNVIPISKDLPDAAARQRIHALLDDYLDKHYEFLLRAVLDTEASGGFTFAVTLKYDKHGDLTAESVGKTKLPPVKTVMNADLSSSGHLLLL